MNKTPTLIAGASVKLCHYAFSQQKLNGSVFFLQELKKKPGNAPPPQKKSARGATRSGGAPAGPGGRCAHSALPQAFALCNRAKSA